MSRSFVAMACASELFLIKAFILIADISFSLVTCSI